MNIQSIIVLAIVVLLFGSAVYRIVRNRNAKSPCSGCSSAGVCGGSCDRSTL